MKDILTESEASEKWCPLSRCISVLGEGGVTANRAADAFPHCIASQCMAWRMAHKDGPDGQERGYCGAFGQPRFV